MKKKKVQRKVQNQKRIDERIRKPISKTGGPMSSKKGKRGYDRKQNKKIVEESI